jgi:hypothetical protein
MHAWILALALLSADPVWAASETKSKSKVNTQLYEQDSETTVTGKVKVVRTIQEETEVFLDGVKGGGGSGPYVLPAGIKNRAGLLKILQNSQKTGGRAVTIGVDDQQRIKSVEMEP